MSISQNRNHSFPITKTCVSKIRYAFCQHSVLCIHIRRQYRYCRSFSSDQIRLVLVLGVCVFQTIEHMKALFVTCRLWDSSIKTLIINSSELKCPVWNLYEGLHYNALISLLYCDYESLTF